MLLTLTPLLYALIGLFLYMVGAFIIALIRHDNGIADIAYGGGFVVVAWISYVFGGHGFAGLIGTVMASIWALRLSTRIFLRNIGKPEDFRYKEMREKWGKSFVLNSFFVVFMLQGAIIFFVVLPVSLLNTYGAGAAPSYIGLLGISIWIIGFFFETVGDFELAAFIRNPVNKGKIMNRGLWRYTRHPNYFGESVMWWGLALLSASTLYFTKSPLFSLLPFIGPALITFLLLKVSGVPLLEKRFAGNPDWEAYKAKTSVFIPWFSKK